MACDWKCWHVECARERDGIESKLTVTGENVRSIPRPVGISTVTLDKFIVSEHAVRLVGLLERHKERDHQPPGTSDTCPDCAAFKAGISALGVE